MQSHHVAYSIPSLTIQVPRLFFARMNHIKVRNFIANTFISGRSASSQPPGWLWFPRDPLCNGCLGLDSFLQEYRS